MHKDITVCTLFPKVCRLFAKYHEHYTMFDETTAHQMWRIFF